MQRRAFSIARSLKSHENPLVSFKISFHSRSKLNEVVGTSALRRSSAAPPDATRPSTTTQHSRCKESHCRIFCKGWSWQKHNRWYGIIRLLLARKHELNRSSKPRPLPRPPWPPRWYPRHRHLRSLDSYAIESLRRTPTVRQLASTRPTHTNTC